MAVHSSAWSLAMRARVSSFSSIGRASTRRRPSTFASISRLDVIVRSASSSQTRSSAAVGVVVVIGNPPFCLLGRWGVEVGGRREPLRPSPKGLASRRRTSSEKRSRSLKCFVSLSTASAN